MNSSTVASGDTVYIKAGTYKLSAQIDLTSDNGKALHLYGGFAGTETTSSDRDLDTNRTTLNASADATNKRRVFDISTNSTVDGFTITGGNITGGGGGGICISSGTPKITNCTVTDNTATSGGGIFIGDGTPEITNCTITGNTANDTSSNGGGGIFIGGGTPEITNCTITGNTATNNGGGIFIFSGTPQITNCTITGNTANGTGSNNGGGGIYIVNSTPPITNCTIVNNTAANGKEISGTTNLHNTLMWNADTANITHNINYASCDHCAYPGATGTGNIALTAWNSPVSSDVKVKGVTHKVYKIFDNYSALQNIIGKGSHNVAPSFDQIGNAFANPPSIGAVEYIMPVLSVDITGGQTIDTLTVNYGETGTLAFSSPTVTLEGTTLTTGVTISWDVTTSPDTATITIDQSGKLTVGNTTPVGTYEATVKAQATYKSSGQTIKSPIAEKKVNITVEGSSFTLGEITKKLDSLHEGKVNTAYSATLSHYFEIADAPEGSSTAWRVDGTLPNGLTCKDGVISGTPTTAGTFTFNVVATVTDSEGKTAHKSIEASIIILEAGAKLDITTLTLEKKSDSSSLPEGKVNTAYSATLSEYFTAAVDPEEISTASITWTVDGTLPGGLTCSNGVISGTPTTAGTFNFNVVATATAEGYNPASKKIEASIIIVEAGLDMTLTLKKKFDSSYSLHEGRVNTAYTATLSHYFTAAVDPEEISTDSITWTVEGSLPDGLTCTGGVISGTPTTAGTFEFNVVATVTAEGYNTASNKIAASIIILEAGANFDITTLTLEKKSDSSSLPEGKVSTAYSATLSDYFTASVDLEEVSTPSITWTVEGTLPDGLTCTDGVISGTPTTAGTFEFNVVATVTAAGYNTVSQKIAASITIESNSGSTDDGETITVPSNGISGLTTEQKQKVKTLVLNGIDDLSKITAEDFPNLTSVKIASDTVLGNNGAVDLSSLPASIKNFSISGNSTVKSLNLKASKVANIDASGCFELKSVDVSGNTFIVTLDVSSTDIELLDASNCSNLTSIDCSYCLLSELNVVACNALYFVDCSHNSLLTLDIPSGLANLASVDCISQELGNWRSTVSFNFDDFSESPDIIQSEDNTASASSLPQAGMVRLSATKLSNVANLKAYNKSGDIIPIIASDDNGNITFASAPDTMTYDYNIGFKNTSMDVTVYAADNELNDTIGSSSCGCNVMKNEGLNLRNILILLLFELALLKLKVKRS